METPPALPHDVWERTPPEAQASIRELEACVSTLEAMVQALQEQRNQTSQNSSRPPPRATRLTASDPVVLAGSAVAAVNPVIRIIPACYSPWKMSMRWW